MNENKFTVGLYQSKGKASALASTMNLADGAYGCSDAGGNYPYLRFSQPASFRD